MDTLVTSPYEFSFNDTEIAFQSKSDDDLRKARLLFKAFNYRWIIRTGPGLARLGIALGLPVKGLIKDTIFAQFCGGESIEDCAETIDRLYKSQIGTILDYSVEAMEDESVFDATAAELKRTIEKAGSEPDKIPFCVFKVSGIGRGDILEIASRGMHLLQGNDLAEFERIQNRFKSIIQLASEKNTRIFIDAEESWYQRAIDDMVEEAMIEHNRDRVIIYNTLQMYRNDRLEYLKNLIIRAHDEGFKLGFKLVRGAYMEKERARAQKMGYPSPIHHSKLESDHDFNEALRICFENLDHVSICAGTHNEQSCQLLASWMREKDVQPSDKRVYFAQLLGMSDHISFNLAHAGYNVAKYVPYGPVREVLPYLSRRAEENSSVKGQVGRELNLIEQELRRRHSHE